MCLCVCVYAGERVLCFLVQRAGLPGKQQHLPQHKTAADLTKGSQVCSPSHTHTHWALSKQKKGLPTALQ